jgi:hypothetical protein
MRISGTLSSPSSSWKNTAIVAMAAPTAPRMLPWRAVLGPDRPLRARMKQIAANR